MILEQLMKVSLFEDINISTITDITSFCDMRELDDGDFLISENDNEDQDIFILCNGSVEIVSNKSQNISNETVLSSGEIEVLGELSWLLNTKRTASVRCKGEVTIIHINGQQLKDYFTNNSVSGYTFMKNLSKLLAKRLMQTDDLLKQILWNTKI
ncbi:MAG: cyclic nucleotide-binding domain-containing protein [Gammaproteobacteria bacterium]|nr:cyclic nucleotide-binding domain-containing protein [Gammaproteobacteria bacterium]